MRNAKDIYQELMDTCMQQTEERAQRVAEASAALRANTERLAHLNGGLERFAAMAAHDLQEPLRKMASFSELLQKEYGGQLDTTADLYLHHMMEGVQQMQSAISNLCRYAKEKEGFDVI